jgi:cytochrome c oxidase subunit 4
MAGEPAHPHIASRKEIFKVFAVLCVLTGLELGMVYMPIPKKAVITALIGLALAKAYTVAMYYMHLKGETRIMKMVVYLPMIAPPFYAIVLMAEAAWRLVFKGA